MGLWIWLACLAVLPTSAALAWVFNPAVTAHRHTAFGPAQRAARLAAMVGTKPTRSLSVIVPAYNEELRIGKMLEPTFAYLEQRARADRAFSFEVVVVDDGSRDGTCRVVADFARRHGGDDVLRLVRMPENRGKGAAIREVRARARAAVLPPGFLRLARARARARAFAC